MTRKILPPGNERSKRTCRAKRHPLFSAYAIQCLLVTLGALETSLGFLATSPFGITRGKQPSFSIQNLYTSEFNSNQCADNLGHTNATITAVRRKSRTIPAKKATISEPMPIKKYNLTLILIDHYDSFTYNLFDMLAQLCEKPPIVLTKDAFDDWSDVIEKYGSNIDGIILSPGPGTPTHPEDIGTLSPSSIQQNPDLPILGVCLGHQILGHVYGAEVYLCGPVHGQVRTIEQQKDTHPTTVDPLWKGIPSQINVTRYHSLAVRLGPGNNNMFDSSVENIPLRATATSLLDEAEDRILMGMSHTENPHYGVQFHPESIGSDQGHQLLRNFCDICETNKHDRGDSISSPNGHDRHPHASTNTRDHTIETYETFATNEHTVLSVNGANANNKQGKLKYEVFVHQVPTTGLSPLEVYEEFLSHEQFSVWLDTAIGIQSACAAKSGAAIPSYSSILGAGHAPIEYYGKEYEEKDQGLFRYDGRGENKDLLPDHDILSFLQREQGDATDSVTMVSFEDDTLVTKVLSDDGDTLPFEFRGGHVGYLGYEVWHDSFRFLEDQEHGSYLSEKAASWEQSLLSPPIAEQRAQKERVPTAAFLFLEKSWVYDHSAEEWYLISIVNHDESSTTPVEDKSVLAMEWMQSTALKMKELSMKDRFGSENQEANGKSIQSDTSLPSPPPRVKFSPNRSRNCYNQNFADCQEQIRLGESYELCLTNQLEAEVILPTESTSPFDLYKVLRERNPAPFSSFLNWNTAGKNGSDNDVDGSAQLALCCSSPERFMCVKRKKVSNAFVGDNGESSSIKLEAEAKPIKGTCARVIPTDNTNVLSAAEREEDRRRALELQASVKNRAENLMIVDLLRNDLSRVCESGSVHVSNLMDIESYATVHQMVSTIRGTLDPAKTGPVDVLKAAFPGGSMTGAPKIRTMEILDRLEEGVSRGPYSGSLGYISLNGAMDMNIVIRSALLKPGPSTSKDQQRQWNISIGAGGAITALSESADEYEEMILKASAVIQAVEDWAALSSNTVSTVEAEATTSDNR